MSKQGHDIGVRKARARDAATTPKPEPEDLAASLVDRGLAHPDILDSFPQTHNNRKGQLWRA